MKRSYKLCVTNTTVKNNNSRTSYVKCKMRMIVFEKRFRNVTNENVKWNNEYEILSLRIEYRMSSSSK